MWMTSWQSGIQGLLMVLQLFGWLYWITTISILFHLVYSVPGNTYRYSCYPWTDWPYLEKNVLTVCERNIRCFVSNVKNCSPGKTIYISSLRNLINAFSHQLLFWFSDVLLLVVTLFPVAWLSHRIHSTDGGLNINVLLLAIFWCHMYFAIYFFTIAFAKYIYISSYHWGTFIALVISCSSSIALQVLAVILWFVGALIAGYLVTLFTDHSSQPHSALGLSL